MAQFFQFSHHAVSDTRDTYKSPKEVYCEQETDDEVRRTHIWRTSNPSCHWLILAYSEGWNWWSWYRWEHGMEVQELCCAPKKARMRPAGYKIQVRLCLNPGFIPMKSHTLDEQPFLFLLLLSSFASPDSPSCNQAPMRCPPEYERSMVLSSQSNVIWVQHPFDGCKLSCFLCLNLDPMNQFNGPLLDTAIKSNHV